MVEREKSRIQSFLGYKLCRQDREGLNGLGGVLYIKEATESNKLENVRGINFPTEMIWVGLLSSKYAPLPT